MKTNTPADQTEWISAQDFARQIQVPTRTVLAWRQRGVGPASAKFGKHIRYRRVDVEAWIAEQVKIP